MAPSNATRSSRLPVFVYFQGGAFNANTRPDFNGSALIPAAEYDMVLVNFNYRVGLWGFLTDGGGGITTNNGLRDQRKVLEWVQKHIVEFGGDPDHVVIGGGSAGAASIVMHMMADGGVDHGLFHGAIISSASYATKLTVAESQYQFNNLATRMGCAVSDPLVCLRNKTTREIQSKNTFNLPLPYAANPPLYQWLPVIDGEMIPDYTSNVLDSGRVIRVPAIIGDDTNGGTDFAPADASSLVESNLFLTDQYPALTPSLLGELNELYPNTNTSTCPSEGCYWRQASDVYGDARFMCPALHLTTSLSRLSGEQQRSSSYYAYRWDVEDPELVEQGFGVPHTIETDMIVGPEYGKDPPASYRPGGINYAASAVIQGYWTSFIRTFDPNSHRLAGTSEWAQWTGESNAERLRFGTGGTTEMEVISHGQQQKCAFWARNSLLMLT